MLKIASENLHTAKSSDQLYFGAVDLCNMNIAGLCSAEHLSKAACRMSLLYPVDSNVNESSVRYKTSLPDDYDRHRCLRLANYMNASHSPQLNTDKSLAWFFGRGQSGPAWTRQALRAKDDAKIAALHQGMFWAQLDRTAPATQL